MTDDVVFRQLITFMICEIHRDCEKREYHITVVKEYLIGTCQSVLLEVIYIISIND